MREVTPPSPLPGSSLAAPAASCLDVLLQHGLPVDGVYFIDPDGANGQPAYPVYCDQTTQSGGWVVFQRRISASDFYRDWQAYEQGFGDPADNYWLGNAKLAAIAASGPHDMRVDVVWNGAPYYSAYSQFGLSGPESFYTLTAAGYTGTAGNALYYHNGMPFTTYDADHDTAEGVNCAQRFFGGFWYHGCHEANLNGIYGSTANGEGMNWGVLTLSNGSVSRSEMKVRER
jgi:hypothetical protein